MPGSATIYTEQHVLSHTLGYGAMAAPTAIFVGLTTTAPSNVTGGTEVAGGGYARQSMTFALTAGTNSNVAANTATVEFPLATAAWGTIGWFELWDALSGGNRLYQGPLVDPADGITPISRTISNGDIVRFTAGVLQVQAL